FVENAFAEDVVDQARALLKKYDSHWEMRVDEKDGPVGLWWKGQSVSFCSLWKIERLMVRRHSTFLGWIHETYYEPCSALQEAQACMQQIQPFLTP
ncbi:nodulation-signaling pathway 1 protein-like protein, partial [Tanacetum coccineum]